jgi:hypothetical protein
VLSKHCLGVPIKATKMSVNFEAWDFLNIKKGKLPTQPQTLEAYRHEYIVVQMYGTWRGNNYRRRRSCSRSATLSRLPSPCLHPSPLSSDTGTVLNAAHLRSLTLHRRTSHTDKQCALNQLHTHATNINIIMFI